MTLKEAINVANQFNDTIFTNTQEMVDAVTVLIDYAESRPEPITGEWLQMNYNFICIGLDDEQKIVAFEKLAECINKAMEEEKLTKKEGE